MKISLKAGGLLYEYLPEDREGNRATLEVAADATAADVLGQLGLPAASSYLVIVNGELVPPGERATRRLAENDQVSINPPLKGG